MDVYLHPAAINGGVYLAPLLPPALPPDPDPDPDPDPVIVTVRFIPLSSYVSRHNR